MASEPAQPVFYYDLGDPGCYVTAERIMAALGRVGPIPEWEPVHGPAIGWTPPAPDEDALAAELARHGLLPLRLPATWPPDSALAMRVATYAKGGGRAVAFSLAAFRQVFAGGRDLGDEGTVLIAAAACEMHPTAVLKGVSLRSVGASLERASERARRAGVSELPAIGVGAEVFCGDGALERAADALSVLVGPGG
ncbi:MAG TPA: DsbA family protein [Solirubrobacteraceae bacterium]|nr:DsbA family protein [Solirubrobacteraceae bacterium]